MYGKTYINLYKPDRVLSFTVYDQSSYIVADRILSFTVHYQ
jgi:hypothetical protein